MRLPEITKELNEMSNDNDSDNSPRKILQDERNKLLRDVMKLRQQQAKLSSSMKPNVRKYQDYQKYINYVNQMQNKRVILLDLKMKYVYQKNNQIRTIYVSGIDEFNTF